MNFLEELDALKIDLYLLQQSIDTTTPAGKAPEAQRGERLLLATLADPDRPILADLDC